jgi:hypothetical protein
MGNINRRTNRVKVGNSKKGFWYSKVQTVHKMVMVWTKRRTEGEKVEE